jgi:hypothetical protein
MLRTVTIESFSEQLAMSHAEILDRSPLLVRRDVLRFGTRRRLATIMGSALVAWSLVILAAWGLYNLLA